MALIASEIASRSGSNSVRNAEPTRFDSTYVQHIVDQTEQMFRVNLDMIQKSPLLFIQRPFALFAQQLRKADDGMQRSPEFVAHAGDELALQSIETLCFFLPRLELSHITLLKRLNLLLGALSLLDVSEQIAVTMTPFSACFGLRLISTGISAPSLRRAHRSRLQSHGPANPSGRKRFSVLCMLCTKCIRHKTINWRADQIFALIAEDGLGGPIRDQDHSPGVNLKNGVRRILDQFTETPFRDDLRARQVFASPAIASAPLHRERSSRFR